MTWCSVPVQVNTINRPNWQRRELHQHQTVHPLLTHRPKLLLLTACKTLKPLISPRVWAKVLLKKQHSTLRTQITAVSPQLWSPHPAVYRSLTVSMPLQCHKRNITYAQVWVSQRASSKYQRINLATYLKNRTSALTMSYPKSNYNNNLTRSTPSDLTKHLS